MDALTLDIWDESAFLGQISAVYDPDAMCEPCEEGWRRNHLFAIRMGEALAASQPPLHKRPILGAYRFTTWDGREIRCLGHLQDAPDIDICP